MLERPILSFLLSCSTLSLTGYFEGPNRAKLPNEGLNFYEKHGLVSIPIFNPNNYKNFSQWLKWGLALGEWNRNVLKVTAQWRGYLHELVHHPCQNWNTNCFKMTLILSCFEIEPTNKHRLLFVAAHIRQNYWAEPELLAIRASRLRWSSPSSKSSDHKLLHVVE